MGIFEDFQRATGMFSAVSPFSSERKIARAVAPALAHGVASMYGADTGANAHMMSSLLHGQASIRNTSAKEAGDTLRLNLLTDANKILEEMRQSGQNYRTKYASDTDFAKGKMLDEGLTYRQKRGNIFLGEQSDKNRDLTTGQLGEILGRRRRSAADLVEAEARPGGYPTGILEDDRESPYNLNSMFPGGS